MSDDPRFDVLDELSGTAALGFAADAVEHLAQQIGDTRSCDVAAVVAFARSYAQSRQYDSEKAHALLGAVKHERNSVANNELAGRAGGVIAGSIGSALLELFGWRSRREVEERTYEEGGASSEYTLRDRHLKVALVGLLEAAEALCSADPHAAARDASSQCRRAVPDEAIWQVQRLAAYQQSAAASASA